MSYRHVVAAFAVAWVFSACSAPPSGDEPSASSSLDALSSAPIEACPLSAHYAVLRFADEASVPECPTVAGRGGTWVYEGPKKVETCQDKISKTRGEPYLCMYAWTEAREGASPDVGALDAIEGAYVAPAGGGGGATCATDSLLPYGTLLNSAGVSCLGTGGPNGPHECDICAAPLFPGVIEGNLWIPASSEIRSIVVRTSSGASQILTIGATVQTGASMRRPLEGDVRIPLPRLPRGTRWIDGFALGYGYTH